MARSGGPLVPDAHASSTESLQPLAPTGSALSWVAMVSNASPRHPPHAQVQRGDIYWVSSDEERGALPPVAHPHVVVQDDVFNRSRVHTVIVCALTSNLSRASEPGNVLLEPGEGQLPRQSVLVVSQISSVERSALGPYIGALSSERVEQALAGLRFQQASFFHR